MIDSLVGVGMLVMLTGWMAGLVSVQYSLSSSRRALSQAEQVEYLRALVAGGLITAPGECKELVKLAKEEQNLAALQKLLVAPELAQRDDGVRFNNGWSELKSNGDIPYYSESQLELLLRAGSASGDPGTLSFDRDRNDWQVKLADGEQQPLFVC